MNIGIYIYDQAEVLDFSGPFEVFSTASRVCSSEDPFSVFLVGETGRVVNARAGYRVIPAYGFHNHPIIDVLIVPGGVHDVDSFWALLISGRCAISEVPPERWDRERFFTPTAPSPAG